MGRDRRAPHAREVTRVDLHRDRLGGNERRYRHVWPSERREVQRHVQGVLDGLDLLRSTRFNRGISIWACTVSIQRSPTSGPHRRWGPPALPTRNPMLSVPPPGTALDCVLIWITSADRIVKPTMCWRSSRSGSSSGSCVIVGAIERSWGMRACRSSRRPSCQSGCATRDFRWKRVMSTLSVVGPVVDVEERALRIDHESCTAQLPVQSPQEQR